MGVDGGEDGRGEGARGQARPVESLRIKRASRSNNVRFETCSVSFFIVYHFCYCSSRRFLNDTKKLNCTGCESCVSRNSNDSMKFLCIGNQWHLWEIFGNMCVPKTSGKL